MIQVKQHVFVSAGEVALPAFCLAILNPNDLDFTRRFGMNVERVLPIIAENPIDQVLLMGRLDTSAHDGVTLFFLLRHSERDCWLSSFGTVTDVHIRARG